jgi:protein disulfide-isomerase
MKTIYLFLIISLAAFHACSQAPSTPSDKPATTQAATPAAKSSTPQTPQTKPVASTYASAKEGWLVDLDEAYEISQKEGKPILANFTGSDWCGWCKKLDADVFNKPEFKKWAEDNVVLLELDFPKRFQIPQKNQSQNMSMRNALGITGFPTIWLVNLTKDPTNGQYQVNGLGRTGYTPTVEQFVATVDGFM